MGRGHLEFALPYAYHIIVGNPMADYTWSAKDRFGNSVVREITADSAEEAKSRLLAEGCTELVLREDEIMSTANAGLRKPYSFLGEQKTVTAADRLKHWGKRPPTFLSALWQGVVQTRAILILILVLAGWEIYNRNGTSLIFVGIGLLLWLAFLIGLRLPSIYYGRLHKAADWHHWSEVLAIVNKLKQIGKFHFIKVPPADLTRYRAKALAAQGQLSEALAEYSEYENRPDCPGLLYKAHVAGIYDSAGQHDRAIELTLKSIQEKPNPVMYLDLANRYLRYKKDAARGRAAIAAAEKGVLADLTKPFHLRCQGILAFLEGDYSVAREKLEKSLNIMEKTPHVPFRDGHISVAKAYLCCVLAGQGDRTAANQKFLEAKAYLVATEETELLEQCQRATG